MGHAGVRSGGSHRGGMGWVMKNIKILNCWCYRYLIQKSKSDLQGIEFLKP